MIGKGRLVAGMAVAIIFFLAIYSIKSIKEVYDREPKTLVDVSFDLSRIYKDAYSNSSSNINNDYSTDSIDATSDSSKADIYLHTPNTSIDNVVDDYDRLTVVYLVDAWSIGDRERLRAHYPVSAPVDLLFGLKWSEDLEWKYLQTIENARYRDIVELVAESYWVYATYRALARRQNMKGWIVLLDDYKVINVDETLHNLQKINSRSILNPYGNELTRNQLIMLPEAIHSSELDNLLEIIDNEEEIYHNFVQNNSAITFA